MDSVTTSALDELLENSLLTQLILQRLPQFGPATYWTVLEHCGSTSRFLQTGPQSLASICKPETRAVLHGLQNLGMDHPLVDQAQKDIDWCAQHQVQIICHGDADYPPLLATIPQAPPVLYVRGNVDNLSLPQIAMVGSRNPTPAGSVNSQQFARHLTDIGFVISSGLALGIDAAAHRGALQNGGATIAVMGTGIDKLYPRANAKLAQQILDNNGTLVTEFPLGTGPQASHFPRRNRIISGMSLGVLVIEAAIKSGSLITARFALQHNREVFAVPGSIHNPLSRGCHQLLREGAILIESVDDMREALQGLLQWQWQSHAPNNNNQTAHSLLNADEQSVLDAVGYETTHLDELNNRCNLEPGELLSLLMRLELKGLVAQYAGGYQRTRQAE